MGTHRACGNEDCTVAQTGKCLLNNDPATCPEREQASDPPLPTTDDARPLQAPPTRPRFFPGLALGLEEASRLMARRYTHIVGLLGTPEAGKTAAIVSLYLLIASAKLPGFTFADSDTLISLDELSRGARQWNNGEMPGEMTGHTELGDHRSAGLLHLRLRSRAGERRTYDLLFPDLPGEWTTQLINNNAYERLSFLSRADAFWVVVDGNALMNTATRNHSVHRISLLLGRICQIASAPRPSVCLVVTRRDARPKLPNEVLAQLSDQANRFPVSFGVFEVASFSENQAVAPGTGLNELLERTLSVEPQSVVERPRTGTRQFLRYRS